MMLHKVWQHMQGAVGPAITILLYIY